MRLIKNQQGYTLLITLLIIIIIVSLFSIFAFSTIAQQKQVEITDNNYEVTAIAEMGVEYYQAHILNLIYHYKQETIIAIDDYKRLANEEKNKTGKLPSNYESEILRIKNFYRDLLKEDIRNFTLVGSEHKKVLLDTEKDKYFIILDKNDEKTPGVYELNFPSDDSLEIHVRGNKKDDYKVITALFNFPVDLTSFTVEGFPNEKYEENPLESVFGSYPITHKNTVKIEPHSFVVNLPSKICSNPLSSPDPCKTDNLNTFESLNNNVVHYIGKNEKNFYQRQNANFGNSKIYTIGDSNFSWMNNSMNLTIQSDGNASFETLTNTKNFALFIKGKGTFKNTLSGSLYTLYGDSDQTFKSTVDLNQSTISIFGPTIFENTAKFSNSTINIDNTLNFNNTVEILNTPTNITGVTLFKNTTKFQNSPLNIFESVEFKGTLDLVNSPLNVAGVSTFKNSTTINNSPLNIKDNGIFEGTLNLTESTTNIGGIAFFGNTLTIEKSPLNLYNNATFKGTTNIKNTEKVNILGKADFRNHVNISNSTVNFFDHVVAPEIHVKNNSTACFRNTITREPTWGALFDIDSTSNVYIIDSLKEQNYTFQGNKRPIFLSKNELDAICPGNEHETETPSEPEPERPDSLIKAIKYN